MKRILLTTLCVFLLGAGTLLKAQLFTNYTTVNGLPDNFICGGVAVDNNNNKWFGTSAGVAKYDNTTWTTYNTTNGLVDNYTTCIAVDKNNNVWVGTNLGVSKFDGTTWTSYTTTDGLIDNGVVYIAGDNDGSVWFVTPVGASKFNGTIWTNYTTLNGLPTDVLYYVAVEPSGNKWFGTQMQGVSVFNNTTFNNISKATMDSLVDDNVFAVAIDKLGQKWIGTRYGISKLGTSNNWLINYRPVNGIYNEWVHDIKIDSNNHVWVVCFTDYNIDGGISVFNGTSWQSYSIADGLADKQVIRLAVDKNNEVWIATGNGVSRFANQVGISKNQTDAHFSVSPNPANDVLYINHDKNAVRLSIYNLLGSLIIDYALTGTSNSIDINDIPAGMYIVQLTDKNNNSYSTKLIKQ